jgi:hypothetical protein
MRKWVYKLPVHAVPGPTPREKKGRFSANLYFHVFYHMHSTEFRGRVLGKCICSFETCVESSSASGKSFIDMNREGGGSAKHPYDR